MTIPKSKLRFILILAFFAMCFQDIFCTAMVIFESQFNILMAGLGDVFGWLMGLISSALAIEEIIKNGWRTKKSLCIIGTISVANFVGTAVGIWIVELALHRK